MRHHERVNLARRPNNTVKLPNSSARALTAEAGSISGTCVTTPDSTVTVAPCKLGLTGLPKVSEKPMQSQPVLRPKSVVHGFAVVHAFEFVTRKLNVAILNVPVVSAVLASCTNGRSITPDVLTAQDAGENSEPQPAWS